MIMTVLGVAFSVASIIHPAALPDPEAANPTTPPAAIIAHQELLPVVQPLPAYAPPAVVQQPAQPSSPDPEVWVEQDGFCVGMPTSIAQANGETASCDPGVYQAPVYQPLEPTADPEVWVLQDGYCVGLPQSLAIQGGLTQTCPNPTSSD